MTALGITAEQVGEMTIEDALDLFTYWRRVPPVGEIVFAAFGGKSSGGGGGGGGDAPAHRPTEQELRHMADLMNGRR